MRPTAHPSTTGATARAVVRASASLVGIVAILIGVPLLLWRLGMPLLPARVPSLHEAVAVFLRPDNGSLLMGTLLVIGVLVWAQLSVSIVAEVVAALRHRPGLRVELPGLRASRLLASVLVAGVLGAGAAGPALAAEPIAAVVRIDHQAGDPATASAAVAASSPTQRELPRYVVQERDSLWRIAEARLGDPLRWREIYDLNHAVVQPDGDRLTDATLLHPGWTLRLPADAATTDVTTTVQPGDTLGTIAAARLHDSRRAGEIFALNVGRPQPNGLRLTHPDRIQPGWHLTLPATPSPSVHPHPAAPSTSTAPTPTVPTVPGNPSIDPKPTTTHPGTSAPTPTGPTSPTSTAPEPTTTAPPFTATPPSAAATPNTGGAPGGVPVGSVAEWGVSALVVSGLVAALTVGRRRQQRRRGYRRRLPVPDDLAGRREWQAVTAPSVVDTATLDTALRGLALRDWSHQSAPDLTRVVLAPDHAALHLAAPINADPTAADLIAADPITVAAPFVPGEDAVTWLLLKDAELPLDADDAGRYCAPYPLLVSVAARDDQLLLLDLEHLGYATVTGNRDTAVGLLRHIAAELANARWSEDVEILLVGFGHELPPLNTDRLRLLPDLTAALIEIRVARRRIATTRAATGTGVVEGRLSGTAPDGWLPVLLLVADLTDTDDQARADLHALAEQPRERGFAVLAHDTAATGTDIHITDDNTLVTQGAEPGEWRVETMTAATAGSLADILAPTTAADLPAGPAEHPEPWAAGMDADGALSGGALSDGALSDDSSSDDSISDRASADAAASGDAASGDAAGPAPGPTTPKGQGSEPVSAEALRQLEIVQRQDPELDDDLATWQLENPPRPLIAVLGEPHVRAPGERPTSRVAWFTEILVYLALHPAGVSQNKVLTDLWPDNNQVAVGTVRTSLSGARRWAGRGRDGDPDRSFISDLNHDQTYRLRGHLLDYDLFRRLRKRAQARHGAHHPGATLDYQAALRLVRGPVLFGLRPTGYAW